MPLTQKRLVGPAAFATSAGDIYTVPYNVGYVTTTVIKEIILCNTSASAQTVTLYLKPYGVTVHSLRKTYAYTLKSSQIHVTTAAKMMGHSNPLVTLKIYTLVLDDEIAKSASAIEAFMVKSSLDNQAKKFAS